VVVTPRSPERRPRVVLIGNIIAPYRIPTLRELAQRLPIRVLFSAETEPGRDWSIRRDLPFAYEVVPSTARRIGHRRVYPSPTLFARLVRLRPDVVISAGFSFPSLWSLLYCRLAGARLILLNEGTRHTEAGQVGPVGKLARRILVPLAHAYVGISSDAVDRFRDLGAPPDSCFRSPYALDIDGRPLRSRSEEDSTLRLLFVGRLIELKGLREFLDALAALDSRSWEFTLAGGGPLEEPLRDQAERLGIADRVRFVGFVDQGDLPALYAQHDVFVLPSLTETFGVVVLEAMAAGLPVIASSIAGTTRDFVVEGETGWVVAPLDHADLVRALEAALEARPRLDEMGRNARRLVEANSPTNSAAALESAVERAVA
jgi:glycosyltransferase involved in cell wall biosynthesis